MPRTSYWYADDPIPAKAIRLGEAYQRVLRATNRNPKILDTLSQHLLKDLRESRRTKPPIVNWDGYSDADKKEFRREQEAAVFFRDRLRKNELLAYIRDPETGEILQLNPRDWRPTNRPLGEPLKVPAAMDDFIDNGQGAFAPNIVLRGAYRPVFLWKEEFERWFKKTFPREKHPGGRPPGSGSWRDADQELILEMHELIKAKKAKSPNDAARLLADRAPGAGSPKSKQDRLRKGYYRVFPLEQN
jgi:hypothetical protein